ncbi:hypothetical protein LTR95_001066 [Oleoguttula sp. CCFEE 5521]
MADAAPATVGTGNTAPGLTTVTILLFLWAALTYAVRIWAKVGKGDKWGADDTAISASLVAALAHVVCTTSAIHSGYGNQWSELHEVDRSKVHKALFVGQMMYAIAVGLTRVSTSFFTGRFLTRDQGNIRLAYGFSTAFGVWTVASVFIVALRAPLAEPWETLDGSSAMWIRWLIVEAVGVVMDLSTFALCVYLIWGLQMPLGKRMAVVAIFACRLGVVPLVVLRLWNLSPRRNTDPDSPSKTAMLFTEAALQAAFILASITCLKPFLRPFHSGYFVSKAGSNPAPMGFGTGPKSSRATYYELSAARSQGGKDEKHVIVQQRSVGSEDEQDLIHKPDMALRPDRVNHRASVGQGLKRPSGMEDDMHISKTQAFSVRYD